MKFVSARNGPLCWRAAKSADECCGTWIRISRPTGQVEVTHGGGTKPLGIYRTPRSAVDATDESLASTALVPDLDDCGHSDGGRLGLVRTRNHALPLRRTPAVLGSLRGRHRGGCGDFCFQGAEKAQPPPPTLPDRAALLVEDTASGSILLAIRSRDDGICHRAGPELLLPRPGRCAVFPGAQYCVVPHRAWDAFPQRRTRRDGTRCDAGMRLDHGFLFLRLDIVWRV